MKLLSELMSWQISEFVLSAVFNQLLMTQFIKWPAPI